MRARCLQRVRNSLSSSYIGLSLQGSGREDNRLISTVFRNGLSVLSITLAVALLAALLLMSGNPNQTTQRSIDAEIRYLQDLDALLDETIEVTWTSRADTKPTLYALADRYDLISLRLGEDLRQMYSPAAPVAAVRAQLGDWFGAAARGHSPHDTRLLELYAQLDTQGERLVAALRSFGANQSHLVASLAEVKAVGQMLVTSLRNRGNGAFADLLFSVQQTIEERLAGRDLEELANISELVGAIRSPAYRLTVGDRESLVKFANAAENSAEWRAGMIRHADNMDIASYISIKSDLGDTLAKAYVQGLFLVNDARVLLNVYTVMLLLVLGYFGVRLQRSHKDLNESHDDLELRVAERTQDLETALHDLKESQVQLVQAEKMSSLGQLVAGVMHEINTPLLYVLNNTTMTAEAIADLEGYLEATLPLVKASNDTDMQKALRHLQERRAQLDAEVIEENTQEIAQLSADSVEGIDQISELVQSLKDFSRLDRAAQDRFNVVDGLEKTLIITRNLWKYGIELEKDFDDVPDIFCSPSRLNQVFINLITNAVQAMDGKGTLKLGASSRDDWVEITLEDTGCGIPEENLNKIMDPFFTTKPVGKGTGLGLSIVHQIVEEHEGQLLVDSKEGIGTRFTLGFPVRRKGKATASGEMQGAVEGGKTLSIIGSGAKSPKEEAEEETEAVEDGSDTGANQNDPQDTDSSHTEAAA